MARCDRGRRPISPGRGLFAGVALIGIGMSLAVGPGVAAAAPSEPSGSSQSADTSEPAMRDDTPDAATSRASDEGAESDSVATATERHADEDADESDEPDVDVSDGADVGTDTEEVGEPGVEDEDPRESRKSAQPASRPVEQAADDPAADDTDSAPVQPRAAAIVVDEVTSPAAAPQTDAPATAAVALREPTLTDLVSVRPVTVNSMVTDVLTWVGLGPLADDLPIPATPVSALMQSLWLAVRQAQYVLNNQRPTAQVATSGPGPDGVLSGSLNAVDFDDTTLTYTVSAAPERGSVVVDALGNFTYTPDSGAPLRGDRFTITVDDTVGNPFHVHGLLGLLGITGPTEVRIVVPAPTAAQRDDLATVGLTDLVSRGGVAVTADVEGTVSIIDGRFTDTLVNSAADAAAVMNSVAPALGAAAGFADPSAITVTQAGVEGSREHFYQFNETIAGITVVGSEVILVTDSRGAVTSLFNNYLGLAAGFDVTPDAAVDTDTEVHLIAGSAYLGSADPEAVESFIARTTFANQLVVYRHEDTEPGLVWQVLVQLPDTGDLSPSGATYLIRAAGEDAGDIIVTISNAQDLTTTNLATDWLGEQRTITVDSTRVFIFTSRKMADSTRNITTYKTSYSFFGLGGPVLPGTVVKRGWLFGWDRAAVSAHANTAVVYDYYVDVLGRTSFDGAGGHVEVSIRYSPYTAASGYANAFWDPARQLFGYGNSGYLQAALDIVGHEFTHAVVSYVVGTGGSVLDYGESGALNEAYADVLGTLIEGKSGSGRWLVGEDSDYGIIRNLADPASVVTGLGPYRSHYATRYTGAGDDGGEHINSTIFSHAAYRMMTAAATSGVSDETWARVFYHSLYRLSPGAQFTDGRAAVLSAATALGLTAPQLAAIADAFDSVGILGAAASFSIAA
ncbi:M4 family metallopeptidase [Mycolicibacterium hippocampi]|uniref:M4 family metallopeptidase n=1 Tax=Mycolicibacterium hippocampi TaxID=659824 RepID=UPI003518A027